MNPDTKQFEPLSDEAFEKLQRHPEFHQMGIFQIGEEIPLRGYRWKVVDLGKGRIIFEVIGQTKRSQKRKAR